MAVKPSLQRTLNDTTPTHLNEFSETDIYYGVTVNFSVSLPFHVGGANTVTNSGSTRGALMPAGVYSLPIGPDDDLWLIAPAGTSPVLETFATSI